MAKINLLPWRDKYREEKKKEFLTILAGVFILAAAASYLWVANVQARIDGQQERNRMLQTEIDQLNRQVAEIAVLQRRREELLATMDVIQRLEGTRSHVVRYFDDLVRAVPEGVFLNRLERSNNVFIIEGIAESNSRVSNFMRNLSRSDWFMEPSLISVVAVPAEGEQANRFEMRVLATAPGAADENGMN